MAVPVSLIAGMIFGAAWGFIPGFLKAVSGAHEVVTTIMLNFVAIAILAAAVSGPLERHRLAVAHDAAGRQRVAAGHPRPERHDRDHLRADHGGPVRLAPVPDDARVRDPDRRREPRRCALRRACRPSDLIIWTMSVSGMLGGMAGATDLLGATHQMTTTYGTTVGFDAIAVALLGRTSPIGIVLAALLFGAMRTGASAMQIQAGVPADLVGVLQATILFFLVVSPVIKKIFGLRGAKTGLEDTTTTIHRDLRRGGDDPLMDQFQFCTGSRSSASSSSSSVTSSHILPGIAPIIMKASRADRVRGPVRRDVRTIRRRQHRHRRDDAGGGLRRLDGRRLPRARARLRAVPLFGATPTLLVALVLAVLSGVVVSLVHAWLSISVKADQIISGTIINIAAFGITGYLISLLSTSVARGCRPVQGVEPAGRDLQPARRRLAVRHVLRPGAAHHRSAADRHRVPDHAVPDPLGPAQPSRSASIRERPRRSASTSSGCAIGTSCSAASWPASAARS